MVKILKLKVKKFNLKGKVDKLENEIKSLNFSKQNLERDCQISTIEKSILEKDNTILRLQNEHLLYRLGLYQSTKTGKQKPSEIN